MILGAHVSTAGGISEAPTNAGKLGIKTFQLFTKNQNRWISKDFDDEEIGNFKTNCVEKGITHSVIHDSYLINLCAQDTVKLKKSLNAFDDEMKRADQLDIPFLVTHPGSHLGVGIEKGCEEISNSLNILFNCYPEGKVMVLLETTAGQGTNIGYKFEQLAAIIDKVENKRRIGICLDTCHIFAAGYDLKTKDTYNAVIAEFDDILSLDLLKVLHLNDSKKPLNSRVDRHENIGKGFIGLETFRFLMNDPRLDNIPGILETPGDNEGYRKDLSSLRKLISID